LAVDSDIDSADDSNIDLAVDYLVGSNVDAAFD